MAWNRRGSRTRAYPLESEEQQAVFRWAGLNEKRFPDLAWLTHVPNGGLRNVVVAARLKAEGTRKGFPDILLPTSRHGFHALAIELKRQKGAKPTVSPEQRNWLAYLESQGWYAAVCYGAGEAIDRLEWYLKQPTELDIGIPARHDVALAVGVGGATGERHY